MRLSNTEQTSLLKHFPNVELSYETIMHKKVYNSDFAIAIPDGRKCFAWFTTFKTQNVCILLEISENKQICKMEIVNLCFQNTLSYGTIFYGTSFKYKNVRYFCTEDVYWFKGKDLSKMVFSDKLEIFNKIYSNEIKQRYYFENSMVFGMPLISNSFQGIFDTIEKLPYRIKYIQFRNSTNDSRIYNVPYSKMDTVYSTMDNPVSAKLLQPTIQQTINPRPRNDTKREIVFEIKPDIQYDIYHLHYYDNGTTDNFYDIAYIPDYKTSVMMNKLFRNIKENVNLDALEESDDETEFEDDRPDKFVFLDKSYKMICAWNYKFKKWTPLRLAQDEDKIVTKKELPFYDKKIY